MRFPSLVRFTRRVVPQTALLLAASAASAQAQTYGEALIQRPIIDVFSNFITYARTPFNAADIGKNLTSFSLFGGAAGLQGTNVGRTITPLLVLAPSIGSLSVVGVGTTRTVGAGINTWDFGLVSGSSTVGNDVYFGWLSSSAGGAVYYTPFTGPLMMFTNSGAVPSASAGDAFTVTYGENRAYSIQWTVDTPGTTPVPEPSAVTLMAAGLAGLAVARRRRHGQRGAQRLG
jgi:hypothetical protein